MKKYDILDGKQFVLVPVLNEKVQKGQIGYSARLVYGYLLYRKRKDAGASCPQLASRLKIDRETARRAVETLSRHGLAKKDGCRWYALEPNAEAYDLLRWQKQADGEWFERFVYDRTFLPSPDCPFGTKANALLWRLVKNAACVARMPGHLFIEKPKFLTIKYLSCGLHCDPQTTRRGLKQLQNAGLIHVVHSGKRSKGFQVGIRFDRRMLKWWLDKSTKTATPLTARELFGTPTTLKVVEDITEQTYATRELIARGIKGQLLVDLTNLLERHLVPPRIWRPMLDRVESQHATNRDENPGYPQHCGKLFLYELKQHLEKEQRVKEYADKHLIQDVEEMNGKAAVKEIKGHEQLLQLLRHLIYSEQVVLDDGAELPIQLSWFDVPGLVRDSMWKKDAFKKEVIRTVFGSEEPVAASWYRQWIEA